MKILMVCLGNICRSPLAEGVLQHKVRLNGLNWHVDSAGTAAFHVDEPPHLLSQKIAKLNGIDISHQRARQFTKEDILNFDQIFVMDGNNYSSVKMISEDLWNENKVDYLLNASYPGENRDVPDPWYGEEDGYRNVFKMIDKACERIIQKSKVKTFNS